MMDGLLSQTIIRVFILIFFQDSKDECMNGGRPSGDHLIFKP